MFFRHLLYLTIICAYILLITIFEIGCPSKFLFGVPCPGCGGTRAIVSLLRLDIKEYFHYHPLALPLGIAIWLMLHARLFKQRKIATGISFAILIANLAFFVWRVTNGCVP
ncbi:MAG: DUF2752 domain-containing protein [Ruminococcaceae bacterium]|nr:DUF2752 domain-containing protein [Oscillospiraceae bacterium]